MKTKARGLRMITSFQKNRLVRVKGKDGKPTGKVYRIGDVKREPGKRVGRRAAATAGTARP